MKDRMGIGDVTERAGVTQHTARCDENVWSIPQVEREGTGQHYSGEDTLLRLGKIDQLKKLGLSLEEIHDVIDLYFADPSAVTAKQKILVILLQHLAVTEKKIDALDQFRTELRSHIERFEGWLQENDPN